MNDLIAFGDICLKLTDVGDTLNEGKMCGVATTFCVKGKLKIKEPLTI